MPEDDAEQVVLEVYTTSGNRVSINKFESVRIDEGALFVDLDWADDCDSSVRGAAGFAAGEWSYYLFVRTPE